MAVSFKVPASPKKDIFDIDTFLGVDLTNSGADMDERRSPNAENMVRYVPGKVRKRTGYYRYAQFGLVDGMNIAKGTKATEDEFDINKPASPHYPDNEARVLAYNITKGLNLTGRKLTLEFDYQADYMFLIKTQDDVDANYVSSGEVTPGVWTHFEYDVNYYNEDWERWILPYNEMNGIYFCYDNYAGTQPAVNHIKIKKLSLHVKDDTYEWHPDPERYVIRDTIDPVYGCHTGKAGKNVGNRVVNVNRALRTHDAYTIFGDITSTKTLLFSLGEKIDIGRKVYIEFDYKFYLTSYLELSSENSIEIPPAESVDGSHFSTVVEMRSLSDQGFYIRVGETGSYEFLIKSLSVMYDKDDNYRWSAAPEDNGGTFHSEDLFYLGSKNYADVTSTESEKNATAGYAAFTFNLANINSTYGFSYHVYFEITTTSEDDIESVRLSAGDYAETFTDNLNRKKIELYQTFSDLPDRLVVKFYLENNGTGKCRATVNNIKVNLLTPRECYYISDTWFVYHVGNDFYLRAKGSNDITKVYSGANKHVSRSWQLKSNLYILDGKDIYIYEIGKGKVEKIDKENAYIPLITIAKEPDGGGTSYDPINLLQPGFYETFQGRTGKKKYQLTFGNLDSDPVKVWVMNQSGGWEPKTSGTDYEVNRSTGQITFTTAPGESPITGEDNIKVLAYRTIEDYRDRITKCTHGTLYGVGGAGDRLFLAGNSDHPNWDFYSQQYDPTYFPDTNYATLGSEQSLITGYAIVNNYLATFKDGFDQSQAVFIREGDLLKTGGDSGGDDEQKEAETTEAVFKLINTLQGEGVIAPYTFGYIQTEPLFLSKHGIYAITEQDITGEKYTQSRSFYLDGKLRKEPNPENAMSCIYDNQYILSLNNHLYILDGLQATRTDKSEPYATRQYAGFYCTNVPAMCIWQDDGVWFGTNDGRVCAFHTDIESLTSYNDDGDPIYACWETPDLDGRLFYKNKTFRYFAVRLMQAIKTSVKMYSRKLGVWNFIREETVIGNPIDFENFDFDLFSFSQDTTEKVIHTKVRVKKVDKARFRVENGEYNEPFGLFDLALEYIESGNYKG